MKTLINLIGEQPIPNLLPVLHLKPTETFILYTDKTKNVGNRLINLLNKYPECTTDARKVKVDPYNFNSLINILTDILSFNKTKEYIFNITGGTKLMSIALFQYAIQNNSEAIYLQSENNKSILYTLSLNDDDKLTSKQEELPELLNVDLYLRAHLPGYKLSKPNSEYESGIHFENAVIAELRRNGFEVIQGVKPAGEGEQVEIDAVFRLKGTNNVAIAEIKIGGSKMERPKKGLDQLSTAGGREYLGIYTKKFLITSLKVNYKIKEAAKAHNIIVIDNLRFNYRRKILPDISKKLLINKIKGMLS